RRETTGCRSGTNWSWHGSCSGDLSRGRESIKGGPTMRDTSRHDAWGDGDAYDAYMGRWSRRVAPLFLDWLAPPPQAEWLEVGCGTGALSRTIVERCDPKHLVAIEPSAGFIARA